MSIVGRIGKAARRLKARLQAGQADQPLRLYVHLPKTAGTSLRNSVRELFGESAVVRDYGPEQAATSAGLRQRYYQSLDPLDLLDVARRQHAVLVCGHVFVNRYGGLVGLPNTCTIVRDPVTRVLSHYRHAVRHQGFEGNLMAFVQRPPHQDLQSRLLCQLDPALFGVIGLTERYRESIDLLSARWGWKLPHRQDNVGGRGGGKAELAVTEFDCAQIRRLNARDMSLYDRARRVFENSLECLAMNLRSEPRGGLTTTLVNRGIAGWACNLESTRAPTVELLVNGTPVRAVTPRLHRPYLAGWGLPRKGYIGFDAHDLQVREGDEVTLLDQATRLVLDRCTVTAPA